MPRHGAVGILLLSHAYVRFSRCTEISSNPGGDRAVTTDILRIVGPRGNLFFFIFFPPSPQIPGNSASSRGLDGLRDI